MTTTRRRTTRAGRSRPPSDVLDIPIELGSLAGEVEARHETGPELTGWDLDAGWHGAHTSGEEAVGGSVQTPDQNIVDELAQALGLEEGLDAPVRSVAEVLAQRDRRRWEPEEEAAAEEEGRVLE